MAKLDFANAFHCLNKSAMLLSSRECALRCIRLLPLILFKTVIFEFRITHPPVWLWVGPQPGDQFKPLLSAPPCICLLLRLLPSLDVILSYSCRRMRSTEGLLVIGIISDS